MAYKHIRIPASGEKISVKDGKLNVPDQADSGFRRRRRHRSRHHQSLAAGLGRGGRGSLRRPAQDSLVRDLSGRKGGGTVRRQLLPGRNPGSHQGAGRRHQGSPDHPGRRRLPLPERGLAPGARPVRLRAPGALLPRRALAGAPPRKGGRDHLPREHRGRLRRHRIQVRLAGERQTGQVPARGNGRRFLRRRRPRHQADLAVRLQAAGAQGHPVRHRPRPRQRDPGAQGQHHEVHGRRLPELGLRAGARRIPGSDHHRKRALQRLRRQASRPEKW